MAPTRASIEVESPPDDVFAYATDPSRFHEWQSGVVSGAMSGDEETNVGSLCTTTRRIGGSERTATSEVTEMDPPSSWAIRGIDGPIRAQVRVTVEPVDGGARSRLTVEVDFEGHGIGKALVPLVVRRQAQREMPANVQRLKERVEATG